MTIQLSDLQAAATILAKINSLNQELDHLQKVAQSLLDGKSWAKMDLVVTDVRKEEEKQINGIYGTNVDEIMKLLPPGSDVIFTHGNYMQFGTGSQYIPSSPPNHSSFQINESEALLVINVLSEQKKSERTMLMAKLKLIGVNI